MHIAQENHPLNSSVYESECTFGSIKKLCLFITLSISNFGQSGLVNLFVPSLLSSAEWAFGVFYHQFIIKVVLPGNNI